MRTYAVTGLLGSLLLALVPACAEETDLDEVLFSCKSDSDCIGDQVCKKPPGVCLDPDVSVATALPEYEPDVTADATPDATPDVAPDSETECADDSDCPPSPVACVATSCDEGVCSYTEDHTSCEDDPGHSFCSPMLCSESGGGCVPGPPANLDQPCGENECAQYACDEKGVCSVQSVYDDLCPDDDDPCTRPVCDPEEGCIGSFDGTQGETCDDGLSCTSTEVCDGAGHCVAPEDDCPAAHQCVSQGDGGDGACEPAGWATRVEVGKALACVILSDGGVACWGKGEALASGSLVSPTRSPVRVLFKDGPSGAVVTDLAVGDRHACALLDDDGIKSVWCWGALAMYPAPIGYPIDLSALGTPKSVVAADDFSCALLTNTRVACWGNNEHGQCGANTEDKTLMSPALVRQVGAPEAPLEDASALAAGGGNACVLTEDNAVSCWGSDSHGQLGTGGGNPTDIKDHYARYPEASVQGLGEDPITRLEVGGAHACVQVQPTGAPSKLMCWGRSTEGAYGVISEGTEVGFSTPVEVDGPWPGYQHPFSLGHRHSCALYDLGDAGPEQVSCMGDNSAHQTSNQLLQAVAGSDVTWALKGSSDDPSQQPAQVSAGYWTTCVLMESGDVRCWGESPQAPSLLAADDSPGADGEPSSIVPCGTCTDLLETLCPDDNSCCLDTNSITCDSAQACVWDVQPSSAGCDDGNVCTGESASGWGTVANEHQDHCEFGVCVPGPPLDCDDGVKCTVDSCGDEGCIYTPHDNNCHDGDVCTIGTCDPVAGCTQEVSCVHYVCGHFVAQVCFELTADDLAHAELLCNQVAGQQLAAPCGDDWCELGETEESCPEDCDPVLCGNGQCDDNETPYGCAEDCDDSTVWQPALLENGTCPGDLLEFEGGGSGMQLSGGCDLGDMIVWQYTYNIPDPVLPSCNVGTPIHACAWSLAEGLADPCSVNDTQCSSSHCEPTQGCVDTPTNEGEACDDSSACTTDEVCSQGLCEGTPKDCSEKDDATGCLVGVCNALTGTCAQEMTPDGVACASEDGCMLGTTCSAGSCAGGANTCEDQSYTSGLIPDMTPGFPTLHVKNRPVTVASTGLDGYISFAPRVCNANPYWKKYYQNCIWGRRVLQDGRTLSETGVIEDWVPLIGSGIFGLSGVRNQDDTGTLLAVTHRVGHNHEADSYLDGENGESWVTSSSSILLYEVNDELEVTLKQELQTQVALVCDLNGPTEGTGHQCNPTGFQNLAPRTPHIGATAIAQAESGELMVCWASPEMNQDALEYPDEVFDPQHVMCSLGTPNLDGTAFTFSEPQEVGQPNGRRVYALDAVNIESDVAPYWALTVQRGLKLWHYTDSLIQTSTTLHALRPSPEASGLSVTPSLTLCDDSDEASYDRCGRAALASGDPSLEDSGLWVAYTTYDDGGWNIPVLSQYVLSEQAFDLKDIPNVEAFFDTAKFKVTDLAKVGTFDSPDWLLVGTRSEPGTTYIEPVMLRVSSTGSITLWEEGNPDTVFQSLTVEPAEAPPWETRAPEVVTQQGWPHLVTWWDEDRGLMGRTFDSMNLKDTVTAPTVRLRDEESGGSGTEQARLQVLGSWVASAYLVDEDQDGYASLNVRPLSLEGIPLDESDTVLVDDMLQEYCAGNAALCPDGDFDCPDWTPISEPYRHWDMAAEDEKDPGGGPSTKTIVAYGYTVDLGAPEAGQTRPYRWFATLGDLTTSADDQTAGQTTGGGTLGCGPERQWGANDLLAYKGDAPGAMATLQARRIDTGNDGAVDERLFLEHRCNSMTAGSYGDGYSPPYAATGNDQRNPALASFILEADGVRRYVLVWEEHGDSEEATSGIRAAIYLGCNLQTDQAFPQEVFWVTTQDDFEFQLEAEQIQFRRPMVATSPDGSRISVAWAMGENGEHGVYVRNIWNFDTIAEPEIQLATTLTSVYFTTMPLFLLNNPASPEQFILGWESKGELWSQTPGEGPTAVYRDVTDPTMDNNPLPFIFASGGVDRYARHGNAAYGSDGTLYFTWTEGFDPPRAMLRVHPPE